VDDSRHAQGGGIGVAVDAAGALEDLVDAGALGDPVKTGLGDRAVHVDENRTGLVGSRAEGYLVRHAGDKGPGAEDDEADADDGGEHEEQGDSLRLRESHGDTWKVRRGGRKACTSGDGFEAARTAPTSAPSRGAGGLEETAEEGGDRFEEAKEGGHGRINPWKAAGE
jgi:hypothetical protein